MAKKKNIKLTEHISYCIIDSTIYLFQNNNLTNIAFALNNKDLDISKLAMFRLKIRETFGAMWLSDYIDNGYIKDIGI